MNCCTKMWANLRVRGWAVALLILAAVHLGFCAPAAAQLNVDRLFPPSVTRGQESTVTAEGKFPNWPVQVWCDRDDISCRIDKESGRVTITLPSDALPGIAWLRFFDDDSASAPVPLLIEPHAVTLETEPNNEIAQATRTDLPSVLVGRLEKANDVDCFVVSVSAGQTLVIDVLANRILGSPMDAVLQLVDLSGNVLAQSDDARGIDPQLVYHCEQDAEYVLRLFAFPEVATGTIGFAGADSFVYRIQVTAGPLLDHSLPLLAPADIEVPAKLFGWNLPAEAAAVIAPATAISPPLVTLPGALGWSARHTSKFIDAAVLEGSDDDAVTEIEKLPVILSGRITRPGQLARLNLAVETGSKYRVAVHSQASGLKLDSVVTVIDLASGKQLARNDDTSAAERDSTVDFTAPSDKPVEIRISDLVGGFGTGHAYSASINQIEPTLSLSLAADRYRLTAGGSVEIPVNVQRQDGFNEKLSIVAVDLPEGVTCEAVVSEAKGDSAKAVKLTLTADQAARYQGPVRIIARAAAATDNEAANGEAAADDPKEAVAEASFPLRDGFMLRDLWLSVSP